MISENIMGCASSRSPPSCAVSSYSSFSFSSSFSWFSCFFSASFFTPSSFFSSFSLVHCCYYISLLLGWWNIVQGGDPLYAGVNPRWDCGGHIWPNWVQFFAKYTWLTRLLEEKNYFGTQNSFSGRWGGIFSRPRSFFGNWGFFRKLRILGVGDEEEDEGDWTQTKFRIYHFH